MKADMVRVDLHVHSKFSKRPSQWILQKLNCPESFTDPKELYRIARKRGMSLVTITDHNSISGCLEIAHLPDTFISEEVTTYFPEDQCKVHVLVYDIDERIHEDIQKARENLFDLVGYLEQKTIFYALAHPLFSVNDRLTMDHLERLLILFRNLEINGARGLDQNDCIRGIFSRWTSQDTLALSEQHGLVPPMDSWSKNLVGGSDDHSALTIGRTYTQVECRRTVEALFEGIAQGLGTVVERASTPLTLARHIYSIAYQYYGNKLNLDRYAGKDLFLRFLDRSLQTHHEESRSLLSKLHTLWSYRKPPRNNGRSCKSLQELLRLESGHLIWSDPDLWEIIDSKDTDIQDMDEKWFSFVNQLSNKATLHFGDHIFDHLSGAHVFNIFHSLGSAGGLYTLLAPYFISFSLFNKGRLLSREASDRFLKTRGSAEPLHEDVKVAHFTDTFHEVNGVAHTLQQQVKVALKTGKNLILVTCDAQSHENEPGVRNFKPIGVYDLPEYPEQKLQYPPFLEMLRFCYENRFSHIHSATPGPIGLAALGIARILKLPIYGTYHTALPQYAQLLTNDASIEELVWKFTLWYYEQMDLVFAPSRSTADELIQRGIASEKIRIYPRGIDVQRFHPSRRNGILAEKYGVVNGVKLLYVGRVSKEKNLAMLERIYRKLVESTRRNVHLIVVGDGPYGPEMQENMKGLPCVFTGYLAGEELASVYASSDIFLFPSATDTFGNVVLEAQASGLPVIVTSSGGPRENMLPGQTGLVARAGDADSFLAAVRSLVTDPDRRMKMGKAARRYTEEHSFETAFNEAWKIYEERHAA